jgi:alcohol dehydrogenase (cytochrome c)
MSRRRLIVLALVGGAVIAAAVPGLARWGSGGGNASAAGAPGTIPLTALAPPFTATQLYTFAGDNWFTNGGNTQNSRYSTLNQVNTTNVAGLKQVWMTHLDKSGVKKKYSQEATPLVYNGVMYISTGNDDVFALDAATGAHLWTYKSHITQKNTTVCCGWDSRGVGLGDGRVYVAQLDGTVVALNQANGQILWKIQNARWQEGYTITMAPLYYNGMVIVGVSGGEFGARGSVTAYNAATGLRVWRFFTVPAPGEIGGGTWSGNGYQTGGASVWNTPTVDPNLGLLYFSTSNADPWSSRGPGDNLFSASIVAIDAATGQYRWFFQTVHHDIWDYDEPSPTVLFDVTYKGQVRHAIGEPSKTGWVYILDRVTGQPLIGIKERKVPQNAFQHTSPTQPIPVGQPFASQCALKADFKAMAPDGKPYKVGCIFTPYDLKRFTAVAPGALGGNNWPPSSFNPSTHALYVCSSNTENAYQAIPAAKNKYIGGKSFIGLNFGFGKFADALHTSRGGTFTAMDMTTNRKLWQKHWKSGCYSGSFTTAGGLVFTGRDENKEIAYNVATGAPLWSAKVGAGANAPGMTYTVNGKQYVAFLAGGTSISQRSKHGDMVYVYALP